MSSNRWIRWDIGYFRNPKARALGKDGRALHLASACWAADNLTDGFIPAHMLGILCAEAEVRPATSKLLVTHGAWEPVEGGWLLHDFLVHNKSKAQVEDERNRWAKQKAGQRGGSTPMSTADTAVESRADSSLDARADVTRRDVTRREECLSTRQTDDSAAGPTGLSSVLDQALDIAARAIWHRNPNAATSNPDRFIAGVRANLASERSHELEAALARNPDPIAAAGAIVDEPVWCRLAARDLNLTERTPA